MNTPGVIQPLIKPYPEGANSARTAGISISNSNTAQQTSLIKTAHGGYRKKSRKGGASTITVPTFQVLYPETGAGSQTVNGNVMGTTQLGATSSSSSVYDNCIGQGATCTAVVQKAGKRKTRGGVKWGCYSGGKKSKKNKKSKKSRKSRKSRRSKRKH